MAVNENDAVRLLASGLIAPGWTQTDVEELVKSGRLIQPKNTNRGAYFSTPDDMLGWLGGGQHDRKPSKTIPFNLLRWKLTTSPIDKLIVLRRMSQMRKVAQRCIVPGKQVGFRVVHERYADPNFTPDESTLERCRKMEKLLCSVNRELHRDVKQFAATAIHEELVIDRKVMLKLLNPMTNKPVSYNLVPGDTIVPRIVALMPWMQLRGLKNADQAAEQYTEFLKQKGITDANGKPIDLTKAHWVQLIDEQPTGAWTQDEMDVDITNRPIELDQVMYGKSAFEQSFEITDGFINAWSYNMSLFAPNFPEQLLIVRGDYDARSLETFKRTVLQQSNQAGPMRVPVITGDSKEFEVTLEKLRETPKDAQFAELMRLIIAMKCAAYGMHPSEINFSPDGGGGTPMLNENSEEGAQEAATEDGFYSILDNLATWWTHALVEPSYDDLVVIWDGLKGQDEKAQVELNVQKVTNYMSLEEVRASENMPPLEIPDDLSQLDITKLPQSPTIVQMLNLKMQADAVKQQQAQSTGMMPPDPNGDYGDEDKDNWFGAGGNQQEDYGGEEPDWFMNGQEKASGVSNFGDSKPSGLPGGPNAAKAKKPVQKSFRQVAQRKYLRIVMEDE